MRPFPPAGSRVIIYSRYSTKNQDYRSIEGQESLCRAYAEKHEWTVVAVYFDAERSGTTTVGRRGLFDALAAVENGDCEALLVEDVDRLSRDAADTHMLAKTLDEFDVTFCSVSSGVVGDMEIGFKAIQNQQYVKSNIEKVRRGQRHVIESGRISGSIAYGYRKVHRADERGKPINGIWEIDPDRAEIVRRIYRDYDSGVSTFTICASLNNEGVPGPRNGPWRPGAIIGSEGTGLGILRNRLYIGEFVWGRTTRKRRQGKIKMRATDASERMVNYHPNLALIESELFDRIQERVRRKGESPLNERRKAEYPLSGKFRCAQCGNSWSVLNGRLGCIGHARMGVCDNSRRVPREDAEEALLKHLPEHLLAPSLLDHCLEAYRSEAERAVAEHAERSGRHSIRLAEIDQRISNLVGQLGGTAAGVYAKQIMMQEVERLGAEKQRLEREVKNKPRSIGPALDTPTVIARLQARLGELRETLNADERAASQAREVLRSLIERVDIEAMPGTEVDGRGAGPVRLTVYGRMAELLGLADLPVDRVIQSEHRMETELDDLTVGFRFSFVLPYRDPRLAQTLADTSVIADVLDASAVPATKQTLAAELASRGRVLDPAERKDVGARLRYALEHLARQGLARAVRAGPERTGWVWNHHDRTDEQWKQIALNPPMTQPLPPVRMVAPGAAVVVVGKSILRW